MYSASLARDRSPLRGSHSSFGPLVGCSKRSAAIQLRQRRDGGVVFSSIINCFIETLALDASLTSFALIFKQHYSTDYGYNNSITTGQMLVENYYAENDTGQAPWTEPTYEQFFIDW
jgi:hypothetical protein